MNAHLLCNAEHGGGATTTNAATDRQVRGKTFDDTQCQEQREDRPKGCCAACEVSKQRSTEQLHHVHGCNPPVHRYIYMHHVSNACQVSKVRVSKLSKFWSSPTHAKTAAEQTRANPNLTTEM